MTTLSEFAVDSVAFLKGLPERVKCPNEDAWFTLRDGEDVHREVWGDDETVECSMCDGQGTILNPLRAALAVLGRECDHEYKKDILTPPIHEPPFFDIARDGGLRVRCSGCGVEGFAWKLTPAPPDIAEFYPEGIPGRMEELPAGVVPISEEVIAFAEAHKEVEMGVLKAVARVCDWRFHISGAVVVLADESEGRVIAESEVDGTLDVGKSMRACLMAAWRME